MKKSILGMTATICQPMNVRIRSLLVGVCNDKSHTHFTWMKDILFSREADITPKETKKLVLDVIPHEYID